MYVVGRIFGAIFDGLVVVFGWLGLAGSLVAISLLLGFVMLLAFKWLGDQAALNRSRDRMQAHLMEIRLFDREPSIVLRAMAQLLRWNFAFFVASLRPAVVATIPMILLFIQMEHYYGVQPLRPDVSAVVTIGGQDVASCVLTGDERVRVDTRPVRHDDGRRISWRIRAQSPGVGVLSASFGDEVITKSVHVGERPARMSVRRVGDSWSSLLWPVEPPFDRHGVEWIDVRYPARTVDILGVRLHWLWWLVIVSVVGAFVLRWAVNRIRPETL